jgi:large subunit ribosomal protein L11
VPVVVGKVKFSIPAGQAKPVPPVSSALGPRGIKPMDFCKAFNEESLKRFKDGTLLPVKMLIHNDKSFTFRISEPSVTSLIKESISLKSGSKEPGKSIVSSIKMSQVVAIATAKMTDLNCSSIDSAVRIISGSVRSMGVSIID